MTEIRAECLRPFGDGWEQPNGEEVREILKRAGLSGSQTATLLGLGKNGGRTVRRWIGEESTIPYTAWAVLCATVGLGEIWR